LCELARTAGTELYVGHSERFNPVVRDLLAVTAKAPLLEMTTRRILPIGRANDEPCLNLAVHDIDLAAFLSRHPVELLAARGDALQVELTLRAGPADVRVTVGYLSEPERCISARTSRGHHVGDLARVREATEEPLMLQAEDVLAALQGRASFHTATGREGALAVSVAQRATAMLDVVTAAE
jgi:hypothetical protein